MRVCFYFFILLLSGRAFAVVGDLTKSLNLPPKSLHIGLKGNYFQAQSFFDSEGNQFGFFDGESFEKIDMDMEFRYGHGRNLELFGGGRFRRLTSEMPVLQETNHHRHRTGKKWEFESFWVGLKIPLYRKKKFIFKFGRFLSSNIL